MVNTTVGGTLFETLSVNPNRRRVIRLCSAGLLFLIAASIPLMISAQRQHRAKPTGAEPTPKPAVGAILAAFDKYEVVGMPEAHGMKDVDDFILRLSATQRSRRR
jgi:hypothetical protein